MTEKDGNFAQVLKWVGYLTAIFSLGATVLGVANYLARASAATKPGPRQAGWRAHVGWAYFLETRVGRLDLDPADPYTEAATENPNNPYAQAMWGHWILWDHCYRIKEAAPHFAAAIASQREGNFVRRLELSALLNCHGDEADQELIRTANAMRKEQRTVSDGDRSRILGIYFFEFTPETKNPSAFINAVPPAEHVATFHWLFDNFHPDQDSTDQGSRLYYLALFQEAAGQRDEALAIFMWC